MFKRLKQWANEFNRVQKELNEQGIFTAYHHFGSVVHYIEPKISTHINTSHDKQETVRRKDSRAKGHRKV